MSAPFPITLARVYDPPVSNAARLLVDRLWPRGVAKTALHLDSWPKEAAPSDVLRKWYHSDRSLEPVRWSEFTRRYRAQLAADPAALDTCLDLCRKGPVVLLTAVREPDHSHASVLREVLTERLTA